MEKHQLISPSALLDISYILTLVTMHERTQLKSCSVNVFLSCFPISGSRRELCIWSHDLPLPLLLNSKHWTRKLTPNSSSKAEALPIDSISISTLATDPRYQPWPLHLHIPISLSHSLLLLSCTGLLQYSDPHQKFIIWRATSDLSLGFTWSGQSFFLMIHGLVLD